ncbi:DUF2797 domain-containing protein [Natrialbaceae archaeon A-CW2]|uniref:DUF2797 domain-containing protein n=1 Tax=Natronosalvus amylolyticus TaxID=2961994 RepID=UPI003A33D572
MQIVGYEPKRSPPDSDEHAIVFCSDSSRVRRGDDGDSGHGPLSEITTIALEPGTTLEYTLENRHCAGVFDGDRHHPCDREAAPHCPYHTSTWVCARCTGTCLKDEMDCFETHVVYLAGFAPDTFKVGVTREWRLETRLREQGADVAAHVHTVADGRIARELEATIADEQGLVDRVRTPAKVSSLAERIDGAAWNALLERDAFDVIERFTFEYGIDLERQPIAETHLSGTVVGTKGRLLVLERQGTTYAVDLRDLVGYELERGTGDDAGDLQSSLGSFG